MIGDSIQFKVWTEKHEMYQQSIQVFQFPFSDKNLPNLFTNLQTCCLAAQHESSHAESLPNTCWLRLTCCICTGWTRWMSFKVSDKKVFQFPSQTKYCQFVQQNWALPSTSPLLCMIMSNNVMKWSNVNLGNLVLFSALCGAFFRCWEINFC